MSKSRLISYCILLVSFASNSLSSYGQFIDRNTKPGIVPFKFNNTYGFADTFGKEVIKWDTYQHVDIYDNLSFYYVSNKDGQWFIDGRNGTILDFGQLMDKNPTCRINEQNYFHFQKNGKSILCSPNAVISYQLNQNYKYLAEFKFQDAQGKKNNNVIIATLDNEKKEIWMIEGQAIAKFKHIPTSEDVKVIYMEVVENTYPVYVPVGLGVQTSIVPKKTKINPSSAQKKYSPLTKQEPVSGYKIYDFDLNHIGEVVSMEDESFESFFPGKKVIINYGEKYMVDAFYPYVKKQYSREQKLNETYAFKKFNDRMHVYKNEQNLFSLNQINYSWLIFQEYKIGLMSNQNEANKWEAFIDFSGVYLPKNRLLMPEKYFKQIKEQELAEFIPK